MSLIIATVLRGTGNNVLRKNAVAVTVCGGLDNLRFCSTAAGTGYYGRNVIVEKLEDGVTTIAINRPEKRNCFNPDTARELLAATSEFESDPEAKVAVLYGKGGTFSAGYDLSYVSTLGNPNVPLDNYFFNPEVNSKDGVGLMGPSRRLFKKPVIAAVTGYAVAGGLELALMCDIRVVEESAILGVFCRRFGVPLIDGGTVRLPALIGLSRAMDLILTGRPVKAKEALEIGLANRICATGTAVVQAIQLAKSLTKYPQECMNRDRTSALNAVYDAKSFQDAVKFELEEGLEVIKAESAGGAKSFVEGVGRHGVDLADITRKSKSQ